MSWTFDKYSPEVIALRESINDLINMKGLGITLTDAVKRIEQFQIDERKREEETNFFILLPDDDDF